MKTLDYHQTLIRKAASLARRAGFSVQVDDAKSSASCYLIIGRPSDKGGIDALLTLRVATHPKPGWRRGGWIMRGRQYYDLRPRSRQADMDRVRKVIASID